MAPARGQRVARYVETYGRGYFGRPSERGYSRTAPVDVQSFRNFVSRQPMAEDTEAQARLAQNREAGGEGHTDPDIGGGDRMGMTLTRNGTPTLGTMAANKETAIRWRQPGTCLWVLESDLYRGVSTGKQISAVAGGAGEFC